MSKIIDFDDWAPVVPTMAPVVPVVPSETGKGNTSNLSRNIENEGNLVKKKTINPALEWCFTLNNPNIPEDHKFFQNNPFIQDLAYQLEVGENGTPHFQGYLRFKEKQRPKTVIPNDKIHWELKKKTSTSLQAANYCMKKEGRIEGPWCKGACRPPRVTCAVNADNLRPWQRDIFEMIQKDPEDRKIQWLWEDVGNFGKTQFSKFLVLEQGALYLSGKAADMKYAVSEWKKQHGDPWLIIIDIPRSNLNYVSYTGIEEIKGGIFFSGKYESLQCVTASPHIIVFANEPPKLENMSLDRWEITNLREKYQFTPAAESSP